MIANGAADISTGFRLHEGVGHSQGAYHQTPGEAIEVLMRHFDDAPDDAVAINDLGVLLSKMGHLNASLDCYRKAHCIAPDNSNIAKNLADLLFIEFGELNAAMALYLGVLQQTPTDCDCLLAAGHISAAIDQFEDAEVFYGRVCQIEPGHPQATAALTNLEKDRSVAATFSEADAAAAYEILMGSQLGESALPQMQAFADRHPDFALVFNDLGVLVSRAGDHVQAENLYRQAITLDPTNTTFLKNLGDHLFVHEGYLTNAAKVYLEVLKLDAMDLEALYAMSLISRSAGDEESAAVFLNRVRQLDPGYIVEQESFADPLDELPHIGPHRSLSDEGPSIKIQPINLPEICDQIQAVKKKPLDASIYVIAKEGPFQDGFSLLRRRLTELESTGKHQRLCIVVSAELAQSNPHDAASFRKTVGEKQYIETQADRLSATLSECLSSDPNPYLALIWDDVRVADGWLDQLILHLDADDHAAIVAPMSNFASGVQFTNLGSETIISDFEAHAEQWHESYRHRRIAVCTLDEHCVLLSKKALDTVGALDKESPILEAAISDWCLRARLAGLNVYVAGDTLVYKKNVLSDPKAKQEWMAQKWNRLINSDMQYKGSLVDLQSIDEVKKLYHSEGLAAALDAATTGKDISELSTPSLTNIIELCVDAEQFEEADRYVRPLCGRSDDNRNIVLEGLVKEGLGEADRAEALAKKTLQKMAEHPGALNLMGILAHAKKDIDSAKAFFMRAIAADPGFGDPYANIATMIWTKDQEAAFELYKTAFILSPDKSDIVELFQMAMEQLARYDEGLPLVLEAITRFPKVKLLRYLAIELNLQLGQLEDAMAQVVEVLCNFTLDHGFLESALSIREQIGPLEIGENQWGAPTLALCMIVKDEAANIAHCLSSVTGLVDEIIVVDTGSKDKTREIAAIMGADVVNYQWNDNFADARNLYLMTAHADWILVLDADEVISKKDHQAIRECIQGLGDGRRAYTITTRNYDTNPTIIGWMANAGEYAAEERGSGWVPTDKVRLFPNDDRLYYSFPVHEMLEPALSKHGYALKRMDIPVHHYGKLNANKTKQKHLIYYDLGLRKLEETGDNAYALRELAIQAGLLTKYNEAIDLWSRFLKIKPNIPEAYINMGTAYFHLGQYKSAHRIAKQGYEITPKFRESQYNYALMAMHVGDIDTALNLGQTLADGHSDYLPGVFFFVCACFANGELEKGRHYMCTLEKSSLGPFLSKSFETFCKGLLMAEQHDYIRNINAEVNG